MTCDSRPLKTRFPFGQPNWSTTLFKSKYTALINLVKAQGLIPVVVTSDPISNVNDTFVQNTLVPLQKQIATDNNIKCLDLNGPGIVTGKQIGRAHV